MSLTKKLVYEKDLGYTGFSFCFWSDFHSLVSGQLFYSHSLLAIFPLKGILALNCLDYLCFLVITFCILDKPLLTVLKLLAFHLGRSLCFRQLRKYFVEFSLSNILTLFILLLFPFSYWAVCAAYCREYKKHIPRGC